ncbi:MAG TPA: mononuclear molybdenum enzyme YedY, partial [Rhodospirillales bacterium]|nr:mononuclear molybdenum enzyme YedY [Rhodospirillales bacterium]
MLIRIRNSADPVPSEITPEPVYLDRRHFIAGAAAAAVLATVPATPGAATSGAATPAATAFADVAKSPLSTTDETLTPFEAITRYNNFYEFGLDK